MAVVNRAMAMVSSTQFKSHLTADPIFNLSHSNNSPAARPLRKSPCSTSEPSKTTMSSSPQPILACPWQRMKCSRITRKEATLQILLWLRTLVRVADQASEGGTKARSEHHIHSSLRKIQEWQILATYLRDLRGHKSLVNNNKTRFPVPIKMIPNANLMHIHRSEDLSACLGTLMARSIVRQTWVRRPQSKLTTNS